MSSITTIRDSLELQVRLSRGQWRKISRESGCKLQTLIQLASRPGYDPKASELARIDNWFLMNGRQEIPAGAIEEMVDA